MIPIDREQTVQCSDEDLERATLEHYQRLSDECCSFASAVPMAIKFYFRHHKDVERLQAEKEGLREALVAAVGWMEDDSGGYEVYRAILDSAKQALSATEEGKP